MKTTNKAVEPLVEWEQMSQLQLLEDAKKTACHDQITENMMCAKENGDDCSGSCKGDLDGPLVVLSDPGDVEICVVSWGVPCVCEDFPGVGTMVFTQCNWIRENVCERISNPPASFKCDK